MDRGPDVEGRAGTGSVPEDDEDVVAQFGDMADEDQDAAGRAAEFDESALQHSLRAVRPGEIVQGTVVEVRQNEVVLHVGGKYEGVIPLVEFSNAAEVPREGEQIAVAVIRVAEDEGQVVLSKKKADYEKVWTRITESLATGETLTAMVTERVKGGLRVDLGVSGFVPASQVSTRNVRDLDRFVGRSLRLRVIEADRRDKKVVLSHRQVVEEERKGRRDETLARIQEGMVCEGKVRNITDYGAFVDLGGVDGLLHISEMGWTRVKHPSEVLKVGDTIQVAVIGIERDKERISLSRRECLPDPWNEAGKRLKTGSVVKAKITRLAKNGAFALIQDTEIEGFIPISEMSDRRIGDPSDVVAADQIVDVKIISLRPQERRMTLSLAEAEQEKERQEYRQYMAEQAPARATLGDQFGAELARLQAHVEDGAQPAAEAVPAEAPAAEAMPAEEAPAEEPAPDEAQSAEP
ncbi:MAG: 30S ribosomal protein S1 [Armatimonadetes bacterium]|nr:30S ribosomal protein S1 [Armatimonadota bacterium]